MAGSSLVDLSRALIDIDSTTGREGAACGFLASELRARGFRVVEQPVSDGRFNVLALLDPDPQRRALDAHRLRAAVLREPRVGRASCYGRGACDAKGALAAQVTAAERLREAGEERVGLLFVVGEERGSDGALAANELPPGARFLVNGEPTGSRLGLGTRGVLRVKLRATGRAAHSSQPERGLQRDRRA